MRHKKFKVQSCTGIALEIVVDGVKLDEIDTEDFVVFRTSEHLNTEAVKSLVSKLNDLAGDKRAILLPKFIEYVVFVEE